MSHSKYLEAGFFDLSNYQTCWERNKYKNDTIHEIIETLPEFIKLQSVHKHIIIFTGELLKQNIEWEYMSGCIVEPPSSGRLLDRSILWKYQDGCVEPFYLHTIYFEKNFVYNNVFRQLITHPSYISGFIFRDIFDPGYFTSLNDNNNLTTLNIEKYWDLLCIKPWIIEHSKLHSLNTHRKRLPNHTTKQKHAHFYSVCNVENESALDYDEISHLLKEKKHFNPGDIVFVGSTYETRQEYGFIILLTDSTDGIVTGYARTENPVSIHKQLNSATKYYIKMNNISYQETLQELRLHEVFEDQWLCSVENNFGTTFTKVSYEFQLPEISL